MRWIPSLLLFSETALFSYYMYFSTYCSTDYYKFLLVFCLSLRSPIKPTSILCWWPPLIVLLFTIASTDQCLRNICTEIINTKIHSADSYTLVAAVRSGDFTELPRKDLLQTPATNSYYIGDKRLQQYFKMFNQFFMQLLSFLSLLLLHFHKLNFCHNSFRIAIELFNSLAAN